MRSTKNVSVWPVGFISSLKAEGCIVKNGKVSKNLKRQLYCITVMGLDARNPVFGGGGEGGGASNKGADHSAHTCNLISAFVIRLLKCSISKLATGETSIF